MCQVGFLKKNALNLFGCLAVPKEVVAQRFHKTADRKNMAEKCICGSKAVRKVAVQVAAGSLITVIQ